LRTHILVVVGSALFVMAPLMSGIAAQDVTRVMQGITSGIGFLGAGALINANATNATKDTPPPQGSGWCWQSA
ncbi:MAG: MgtC/SapB family protein, partial [Pseudoxanthomonas sp.]